MRAPAACLVPAHTHRRKKVSHILPEHPGGGEQASLTRHGVARAQVGRGGTRFGGVPFTTARPAAAVSRCRFRSSASRSRRRHLFPVRPVTQRRHADAGGQDDQPQEEEEPRGGVQAQTTSNDHDVRAPFPLPGGNNRSAVLICRCGNDGCGASLGQDPPRSPLWGGVCQAS